MPPTTTDPHQAAATVRAWLQESDRVLIGAGAGLSAAAGYDYGDTARFAELFPAMHAQGFRARYELIGRSLPAPLMWGYWFTHVADVRYSPGPHPVYRQLRELVAERDHFVMTSNVDALFARNGFDPARVFTPQGDYGQLQCTVACTRQTWDTLPALESALASYDATTGTVTDPDAIPRCPRCGDAAFLNVHVDGHYVADAYLPAGRALEQWLNDAPGTRLLVLDLGSGYSTPGVVRWPIEQVTHALPGARLVRVNPGHPEVHPRIADRSLPYAGDTLALLRALA